MLQAIHCYVPERGTHDLIEFGARFKRIEDELSQVFSVHTRAILRVSDHIGAEYIRECSAEIGIFMQFMGKAIGIDDLVSVILKDV